MNANMPYRYESDDALDRAVSARLAKLRAMPVDVSRLERVIEAHVRPVTWERRILSWHPLRAVAASVMLVFALAAAVLLSTSSGPALAEPAQMAQVHHDIVAGRVPVTQVDSIEAANRVLGSEAPDAPILPQVPDTHVMACCMSSVHDKRMACVLLKENGAPVTLAVARAADVKPTPAPVASRNGHDYRVQKIGDLTMVMTERDGKWLCLVGQVPADRLMDLAAQVRF